MKKRILHLTILLTATVTCSQAFAAKILSPNAVTQNTLGFFSPGWQPEFAIDQSGLSSGFISGVDDFDAYIGSNPTHASGTGGNMWFSGYNLTTGLLDFDLGGSFTIERLAFWLPGNSIHTTKDFTVFTSSDVNFTTSINVGSFTSSSTLNTPQIFDLTDSVGRYVRFEITSNHGGCCAGIGELAFDVSNVSTVPVPAAFWLFTTGILCMFGVGKFKSNVSAISA